MADKVSFMKAALRPSRDIVSPVPLVPFADWDYYYTCKPLEWHANAGVDISPADLIVPEGFVTDLASIPPVFWAALPPAARYSYPAILHDYLYWFQPCKRENADGVLKAAMEDMEVSSAKILAIYSAVRAAGGGAWDANAKARAVGEKRIIKIFPTDPKMTWWQWKQNAAIY